MIPNQSHQPVLKTFTHVIRLPPLTDTAGLIGAYRSLFENVGVNCNLLPFPAVAGFSHPIETEQQVLLKDFMDTMQLFQNAILSYGSIDLINARATTSTITFVLQYKE